MDLVGYRRRGHNELDSPMITLPLSYNAIDAHPTVLQQYASRLEAQGMTTSARVQEMRVSPSSLWVAGYRHMLICLVSLQGTVESPQLGPAETGVQGLPSKNQL